MKSITCLMLLVMGMALLQIPSSCTSNKQKDDLEFYYYPSKNVYYNTVTKNYFYSLDGTKTWDSTYADLANNSALGDKKIVHSAVREIWKQNEQHRKEFDGVLYNLNTEDSALASAATVVSEKKDIRRGTTVKRKADAKREKTKFGKFIDKIFGKKKKEK